VPAPNNTKDNVIAFPDVKARGGGGFFAIDKRAFGTACELGLNPAVAYLTIARGAGRDNAASFWSVNAIEEYTGISRPKANAAVQLLIDNGVLRKERGGKRPRYQIEPGHEIPPRLSPDERDTYDEIVRGKGKFNAGSYRLAAAGKLVARGLLKQVGTREFVLAPTSAEPQWIWLPNAIVEGAADEIPPLRLLRQMQDVRRLRLFVAMYDSHDLANDGGISRTVLWQKHTLTKEGKRGASTIWAFEREGTSTVSTRSPLFTIYAAPGISGDAEEMALREFWAALAALEAVKLVEFVPHIFESDKPEAELIHSYAVSCGEPWETELAAAAHEAGFCCLSPGQQQWTIEQRRLLVPIPSHIDKLAVIGIARLKYRPQTRMTAAWFAKSKEQAEAFTPIYQEIVRNAVDFDCNIKEK
jgi:hypothetical protein